MKSFESIEVNEAWSFTNARSTDQWTHGYHRYPAKFLPNLVQKLIEEQTSPEDTIVDLFAGCGTTLVESKVHGRKSIGFDINPVAELITRVKTNPIEPKSLQNTYLNLVEKLSKFYPSEWNDTKHHERIDYWFTPENKAKIAFLYHTISSTSNGKEQDFFLVSLSHILKNCSRWLQSSTKPQIDPNKKIVDPFEAFQKHTKTMMKKNEIFYNLLTENKFENTECTIVLRDSKDTKLPANSIGSVITSPPYITSYEYADIHQLTAYWFEFTDNLLEFRKGFIGTFYSNNKNIECTTKSAQKIVNKLLKKDVKRAREVANYFNDMESIGKEMYRIVKKSGRVCIVIGNTMLKDVKIYSAEVFYEMLLSVGFKKVDIIKRNVTSKLIPAIRDKNTGKFTTMDNTNSKLVYPEEYILILKK